MTLLFGFLLAAVCLIFGFFCGRIYAEDKFDRAIEEDRKRSDRHFI